MQGRRSSPTRYDVPTRTPHTNVGPQQAMPDDAGGVRAQIQPRSMSVDPELELVTGKKITQPLHRMPCPREKTSSGVPELPRDAPRMTEKQQSGTQLLLDCGS